MIESDINERMARFMPSQNPQDFDPIAAEIADERSGGTAVPTMPEMPDPIAMEIAADRRAALNSTVLKATQINPDQAARAEMLGRSIGIPQGIALADMQRAEQRQYLNDLNTKDLARRNPTLANFLENEQFAQQAHDDIGVLSMLQPLMLEAAMIQARGATAMFDAVSRGYQRGNKQTELGEMQALGMVRFTTPQERDQMENLT